MRVLITGGAGFIGSHLTERLVAVGHEVRILDSLDPQVHQTKPKYLPDDADFVLGDVRDAELVRKCLADVDLLVHLAAAVGVGQSMYEITHYTSVNALGAAVVLEEAIALKGTLRKIVVASSMSIYGEGGYWCPQEKEDKAPRQRRPEQLAARSWELECPSCGAALEPKRTPESKPLQPTSIYAIGKRDHEEMFLAWGSAYEVPVTALRFFNVYGPRQSLSNPYTGVSSIFASRLLNARPPVIFEDGRQSRDFVHVSDIVNAVESALSVDSANGVAINVGTGRRVTVLEVAAVLAEELGQQIEPDVQEVFRAGDVRHCYADISLARRLLDFEPAVEFRQGMAALAAWLADQQADDLVNHATQALTDRGLTT